MTLKSKIHDWKAKIEAKKAEQKNKAALATTVFLIAFTVFVGSASADTVLNTTAIMGIFTDLGTIFPAIGNFIVQVLPTLMTLAVVGFVLKFFDKILSIFDKVF